MAASPRLWLLLVCVSSVWGVPTDVALGADPVPTGSLDSCTPALVAGWASDTDWTGPIAVHIYVDGTIFKALVAGDFRKDVGAHGFNWVPPPLDPGSHSVAVYAIGVDSSGNPDNQNIMLAHAPQIISDGCAGFEGSALAWCQGVPTYFENRQSDTTVIGNDNIRVGVDLAYGGTMFQMYGRDWTTNLVLEHGGGAVQLSIWGYDPVGGTGFFRLPTQPRQCDPTPYADAASCVDGGSHTCVARCCSKGTHVLDCKTHFPCGGWSAGAPWNPIQAQGKACGWLGNYPVNSSWSPDNTEFYTSLPLVWHFTSDLPAAPLRMEQWTKVVDEQPFVTLRYRMTYTGGPVAWTPTTQEIPAFFTSHGVNAIYYYYGGAAAFTHDTVTRVVGSPRSFLRLPNRPQYPHPDHIGNATESWWGVCDAAEERCVTLACFHPLCAEAAVSDNGSGEGYITPIGYFGVTPGMDVTWEVYAFPYRYDAVVIGTSVRDWIHSLATKAQTDPVVVEAWAQAPLAGLADEPAIDRNGEVGPSLTVLAGRARPLLR